MTKAPGPPSLEPDSDGELPRHQSPFDGQPRCLYCGEYLGQLPPSAPHKRFCSADHRIAWHKEALKRGAEALKRGAEAGAVPPESQT